MKEERFSEKRPLFCLNALILSNRPFWFNRLQGLDPFDHLIFGFPDLFLKSSDKLIVFSFFICEIIVGQLTLLLLNFTLKLVPVAF
jgi:hypothetical protein